MAKSLGQGLHHRRLDHPKLLPGTIILRQARIRNLPPSRSEHPRPSSRRESTKRRVSRVLWILKKQGVRVRSRLLQLQLDLLEARLYRPWRDELQWKPGSQDLREGGDPRQPPLLDLNMQGEIDRRPVPNRLKENVGEPKNGGHLSTGPPPLELKFLLALLASASLCCCYRAEPEKRSPWDSRRDQAGAWGKPVETTAEPSMGAWGAKKASETAAQKEAEVSEDIPAVSKDVPAPEPVQTRADNPAPALVKAGGERGWERGDPRSQSRHSYQTHAHYRGRQDNRGQGKSRIVVPSEDFDFEAMNEKFDKVGVAEDGEVAEEIPKYDKKYDASKSFFDDLVSERASGEPRNKEFERKNMETFGEVGPRSQVYKERIFVIVLAFNLVFVLVLVCYVASGHQALWQPGRAQKHGLPRRLSQSIK
mmetsp:Transcript_34671/g.136652  ORF Transcript_34671/g.136652 Transcript_34671/m.136652 type:complete len:421 (+) Transcript_34671:427-1689(+)